MFSNTEKDGREMFYYLVYEMRVADWFGPSVWSTRAYWSPEAANRRARALQRDGRMAFVEAR